MRAYAYAHGSPLPEAGSFQEQLLSESIARERHVKFSEVSLFATLLGKGLGINDQYIELMLEGFREELYQLRYNSKYKTARRRFTDTRMKKAREQDRLFRKLDAMTAIDTPPEVVKEKGA